MAYTAKLTGSKSTKREDFKSSEAFSQKLSNQNSPSQGNSPNGENASV